MLSIAYLFLLLVYLSYAEYKIPLCVTPPESSKITKFETEKNTYITVPRCVTSLENILDGRFRNGVSEGRFEAVLPSWFNATLATLGQNFAKKYWVSIIWGTLLGEWMLLGQAEVGKATFTAGEPPTAESVMKRYISNALQVKLWYMEDLFGPRTNLLESLTRINSKHLVASHTLNVKKKIRSSQHFKVKEDIWLAFEQDLNASDTNNELPTLSTNETYSGFNQFVMSATIWGFAGLPIIRPHELGLPYNAGSEEEMDGFIHFWAAIGYGLGVEDEFNICLQPNLMAARIYFERFLKEMLVPGMRSISHEAKVMCELFGEGLVKLLGPIPDCELILRGLLEDVIRVPSPHLTQATTYLGRLVNPPLRYLAVPALRISRNLRGIGRILVNGVFQYLSLNTFGITGTNQTVVAELGF